MNIISSNNYKAVNSVNFGLMPRENAEKKKESIAARGKELLSSPSIGQSQIGADLPVSYTKTGEIPIPGLKNNAVIYKLSNGQRVIIAQKKGPAFIHTTYNVGSMNEPDNLRGISHYIEHNLFNGSKNLAPKEYDLKVSKLGGSTNASTSFAFTDYHLQLQLLNDNSLEEAIKLNAMQTQFPAFSTEQLTKEKGPVKSEIDMCSDATDIVSVCKTLKNLFKIKTKSEDFVIGTKENINSFNRDTVMDYFNTWYTPDNAVTVITGEVNPEETINLVSKYFNKKTDYTHIHKRYYEPIEYNDKPIREDIIKSNTMQPLVTMGFAIPEGTSVSDLNKIDFIFNIMKCSNSDFYKSLENLGASIGIFVEKMQNKPDGARAIIIQASANEDKLEETIKTIYKEINSLANYQTDENIINNTKKTMISRILSDTESSRGLNNILTEAALTNNYNCINSAINDIKNISAKDIAETSKKYLDLNKISICVAHDKNSTKNSVAKNYNKSVSFGAKICPVDNLKEETSKIRQIKLPNNIESTVINGNDFAKSVIRIDLYTNELNQTTSPELMLLGEMLKKGSSIRGKENFNNILNSKDISMSFDVGTDGISGICEFNDENLEDSIKLIKEKLLYPNFDKQEFLKAKKLVKESIQAEKISAFNKLNTELYPDIKSYEDKETRLKELEKLTLEDIKKLHSKIMAGAKVQALMIAPLNKNPNAENIFNNELIANMPVFKPFTLEENKIYKPNTEAKLLTQEREQAQAEIVQGYKFKRTKNIDDIAKIELLNMILGSGGMSSRLFLDLREDKKLAYSVGSRLMYEKDTGVLCLKIKTTTESNDLNEDCSQNTAKSIEGFNRNVNRLKTELVTDEELENAKIIYKTRILNKLETNMSKSLSYLNTKYSPYGINYNEKLFEAIDKITPKDILAAANYVFKNPPVTSIAASKKTLERM